MLPLEGLRVLDLSRLLPGPYCTLLLADLGADVVKVEDVARGDYLRWVPPMAGASSAAFQAFNRNKRSVAVDLRRPEGRDVVLDLVRSFDTVVESFRPGVLDGFGLGYERLQAVNPRAVLLSISGYPARGPERARAGHDLNYVARAGIVGLGARGGEPPAEPGVQIADVGGAFAAAFALLVADRERARTGRGRHLEVSLYSSALAFMQLAIASRLIAGPEQAPLAFEGGALAGALPCYRLYRTADGRALAVAALEPKFWVGLCEALGLPELADRGWEAGPAGEAVAARLGAVIAARTLAEWQGFFAGRDLCCEPVRVGEEILTEIELMDVDAFFNIVGADGGQATRHLKGPVRIGEVPARAAPRLGEHTDEVLAQSGFSAERVAELRRAGAVG